MPINDVYTTGKESSITVELTYQQKRLAEEIKKAAVKDRQSLLTYNERREDRRIPLVVTYDNRLPDIKKIVNENWDILQIN